MRTARSPRNDGLGRRGAWLALLLSLSLVTACGGTTSPDDDESGSADTFTFGMIIEETGNASIFAEPTKQGYQVAIDELNARGGPTFDVATCDGGSNPQQAIDCYERLVQREEVDALVGPTISASVLALDPLVRDSGKVLYYLGGGYGERDMGGNPTMFGALSATEDVMAAIFEWGRTEGYENAYVISTADATGNDCREFLELEQYADRRVLEVVGQDEMAIDAQSAAPQMAKVPADVDMVVLCGTGGAGTVMAASFEQAGLDMPAVALHSQGLPAVEKGMQGAVSDNKIYVAGFCPLAAAKDELPDGYACTESTRKFTDALRAKFPKSEPNFISAATYDALMQIGTAVSERGASAEEIGGWIEAQQDLPGANGIYNFGPDQHRGMGPESIIMGIYRDGGFHLSSMLDMPKTGS